MPTAPPPITTTSAVLSTVNSFSHETRVGLFDHYRVNYIDEGDEKKVITKVEPVENEFVEVVWDKVPISGTYKISAEAKGWNGGSAITNEVYIVVTNLEETESTTATME